MGKTQNDRVMSHSADIPIDESLPGLSVLMDPSAMLNAVSEVGADLSARIDRLSIAYVRYKPGVNCVVSYRAEFTDPESGAAGEDYLFGKCHNRANYSNAAKKASVGDRSQAQPLRSPVLLPEIATIVSPIDCDRGMDGIRTVYDSRKLVRLVHEALPEYPRDLWRISDKQLRVTTVRFKPEKRAVFRIKTKLYNRQTREKRRLILYLRTYNDDRGQAVYSLMELLYEASGSSQYAVPNPLSYLPDKRLLLMKESGGTSLLGVLQSSDWLQGVRRAASVLAATHRAGPRSLSARTTEELLADATATGTSLAEVMPECRLEISRVLQKLDSLERTYTHRESTFVHGDFYYDQVLLSKDNSADTILDFDRSFAGDPIVDVANFCAHLHLLGIRKQVLKADEMADAFVSAYEDQAKTRLDRTDLALWTAWGLLLLSVGPFRTLESGWRKKSKAIIAECLDLIP